MPEQNELCFLDLKDDRWMTFIDSHPQANIFHHPAWIQLLFETYHYRPFIAAILDAEDKICAGIPVMEVKSLFTGRRWVSLPFSDYCIPLAIDEPSLRTLIGQLVQYRKDQKIPNIELRWELPGSTSFYSSDAQFVLQTIALDRNPEVVAKRFERVHRQNIRSAEKRGVIIEKGEQVEHMRIFYELQVETRHRKGIPAQPWSYFKKFASLIFEKGLGFVLLARKDEEYLAGIVFFNWGKSMVAKYAASREDRLNLRPNNLLFWTGIQWGCENGFAEFDMGRTDIDHVGLRRYKKGWGATEKPLYYSTLSTRQARPTDGKVMDILHHVIQNSPAWVCRISGELLYRHIG